MAYVSSVERIGIKKGMQQGLQQGRRAEAANLLLLLLNARFAPVSEELASRVQTADADVIEVWFQRAITAPSLAAVFGDEPASTH